MARIMAHVHPGRECLRREDVGHDMTVRATWHDVVLAESDRTILVEGNQYFPPEDVVLDLFEPTGTQSHCPWKGDASYYDVVVGSDRNADAAWYYPAPFAAAESVKDYVAFWKGVEVTGTNENTPVVLPAR
jgi:uncharacterized protein (DUF427 family)